MASLSIGRSSMLLLKGSIERTLVIVAAVTALGDWLFYRHTVGISLPLFVVALASGVLLGNPVRGDRRAMLAAMGVLLAALLPLVDGLSPIALLFGAAGVAYFAVLVATPIAASSSSSMTASVWLLLAGPFQLFPDLVQACKSAEHSGTAIRRANPFMVWIVPIAFGGIFLLLFASANPLIEGWFAEINLKDYFARIDITRMFFWLIMMSVTWPFIYMNGCRNEWAKLLMSPEEAPAVELPTETVPDWLFGEATILRSLALFNLLFAVQTVLDINYLWGGVALPHGMSYATYAHRGAYPLIFTAILAAGFVIAAMRPGSTAERSPSIRILVFLWTAQNVLLVASSMLRLDLYVEAYSLTYLRAAAFIWMLLVALGLILIVARIVLDRSNAWLIAMNLAVLVLTIYICGFINFPHVIATYNVAHSRELSGKGEPLDTGYLFGLGAHAIPALDLYIAQKRPEVPRQLLIRRDELAASHLNEIKNWRAWNFRGWRLKLYLEGKADGVAL